MNKTRNEKCLSFKNNTKEKKFKLKNDLFMKNKLFFWVFLFSFLFSFSYEKVCLCFLLSIYFNAMFFKILLLAIFAVL